MTTNSRTCLHCGSKIERGITTFTVDLRLGVVLVRDMLAHVCVQGGEACVEDSLATRPEIVVEGARWQLSPVGVTTWQEIPA